MRNFIILSSCGWTGMLQRPHQMARALARLGNHVHFIEPVQQIGLVVKDDEAQPNDAAFVTYCLENMRVTDGVFLYRTVANFNGQDVRENSVIALLKHLIEFSEEETVIILYLPYQIIFVNHLRGIVKLVYDCVDDHSDLTHAYWSSPLDIEYEALLLDKADMVLTSSSALYLSKSFGRAKVYLLKNAVNPDDFTLDSISVPHDLEGVRAPRICYMGAVDQWFDEEVFYSLVEANSDKSFVVIGPVSSGFLAREYPNLYLLGPKRHNELKNYLANMDLGIIPFKAKIDLMINCNPIKLYEYLACGLPVVSTLLPEMCLDHAYIKVCGDFDELNSAVNAMLKVKVNRDELEDFIRQNTWEERAKQFLAILDGDDCGADKCTVISRLRGSWSTYLNHHNAPVLTSLYALTFAEDEPQEFLRLSREAYQQQKTSYTVKNYLYALCLNDRLEEAVTIAIGDSSINELYKAELISVIPAGEADLIRLKLFYCIKKFDAVRKLLIEFRSDETIRKMEIANYCFETGRYDDVFKVYTALGECNIADSSPLFNRNLSKILTWKGSLYDGQMAYFRSLELIDQYLGKKSRVANWIESFEHLTICDLCGSSESENVIVRPDRQQIVVCKHCGLAYLKKMPLADKLKNLYNSRYYRGGDIAGYGNDYNQTNKSGIFLPRLEWIENTIFTHGKKRMLDIGCADGAFLSYAKEYGWDVYGIEISEESCNEAQKKKIKVFNQELCEIGFESDFFDCITLWDVIEHFLSPKTELQEIYRILRADGKLYISTPNHLKGLAKGKDWFGYNASYEHLYYFEPNTLIKLLTSIGFKIDDCFSHEIGDWKMANVKNTGHILLLAARK